jgi:hypothetical protein
MRQDLQAQVLLQNLQDWMLIMRQNMQDELLIML